MAAGGSKVAGGAQAGAARTAYGRVWAGVALGPEVNGVQTQRRRGAKQS